MPRFLLAFAFLLWPGTALAQYSGPALAPEPPETLQEPEVNNHFVANDAAEPEPLQCAGITCSGHGQCAVDSSLIVNGNVIDRPFCRCDEGYLPAGIKGLSCMPAKFAQLHKQYRTLSASGHVLTSTSMALLLASQVSLTLHFFASDTDCIESPRPDACSEAQKKQETTMIAWNTFLFSGMSLFGLGFPLLDVAQRKGLESVSWLQDAPVVSRKLRAIAWTFYGLSFAFLTAFIVALPIGGGPHQEGPWEAYIVSITGQSLSIACAQVASILNLASWRINRKAMESILAEQIQEQRGSMPFISPVHGGFMVGVQGIF